MKRLKLTILTILFFCSIFLLFVFTSESLAVGKATSMGDLQTVVPTGPFDVTRNPALLPLQDKSNSTGLFFNYIAHYPGCSSASHDQYLNNAAPAFNNHIDSAVKQDDSDIKGMSGHIANSTKTGGTAFGFAVTDNGDDQYSVTKRKSLIESIGYDGSNVFYNKKNEVSEVKEINPAFITSIGTNISNTSFIGFQIVVGYSNEIKEKKLYIREYLGVAPVPVGIGGVEFNEKSEKEIKKLSAQLGFGYLYGNSNQQFGLMIGSGEVAWTEKTLKIRRDYIIAPGPSVLEADSSVKMNGKYVNGPSFAAGAYKKINSFFAMAFETGIRFEISVADKDLECRSDHMTMKIEEQKSINRNKNLYSVKAGIELSLAKSLTLTTGLGYMEGAFETNRYRRKGTTEESVVGNYETKRAFFTLGVQYIISNNVNIDLLAACSGYRDNINLYARNRDTASTNSSEWKFNQKEEGIFGYTGLGVTLSL